MTSYKKLLGLMMAVSMAFSASADEVILDDLIVRASLSDGTVPAYDCSAPALPFFFPGGVDPSAAVGTIPDGDPIVVPEPIFPTCVSTGPQPWMCEFSCNELDGAGAACFGFDCMDNEPFDGDELKLRENNLRIRLHDTSIGDVLGQSWNVQANASGNSEPSYFEFQVKSLEQDSVLLSEGGAPDYDCDDLLVTPYPVGGVPSIGTIPVGEPAIFPTFIPETCTFPGFLCLHTCENIPWWTEKSLLKLGTASNDPFGNSVAIGYDSAIEDGVVTVGRAELLRRIAHVAAGMGSTDALTVAGLQSFTVADLEGPVAALVQQIIDWNALLDEIEILVTIAEIDALVSDLLTAVTSVGPGASLVAKIKAVQAYIDADDIENACSSLNAFLNEVSAQTGKKLTPAQAASFTDQANAIKTKLGCP